MFSYKMLSFIIWLMTFSVGYLLAEVFINRFVKENDSEFLKYARIVLFVLSFGVFVWLLFNKESFHWNFDIATGEPVNHYSTYGKCMLYTVIAMVSNVTSFIIAGKRKS